jgi:hypothetical protein
MECVWPPTEVDITVRSTTCTVDYQLSDLNLQMNQFLIALCSEIVVREGGD